MFNLFPLKVLLYQVYLLQLEEYSINRYVKLMQKTKGIPSGKTRKNIDWTQKLLFVFFIAFTFQIILTAVFSFTLYRLLPNATISVFLLASLIFFCLFCYIFFAFLLLGLLIASPLDSYLKKRLISQARIKISGFKQLKVIGIAGSYGKTTMKELLSAVLSQKFSVVKTPRNLNTPLGIARTILKDLKPETEYFIVEMGEYTKGDIKELCSLTKPDIAVVTGINEAHLERMGGLQNTISTVFEVVENMENRGIVLLNSDDEFVKKNYEKFVKNQKIILYGSEKIDDLEIKNVTFEADASGISFEVVQRGLNLGKLKIAVLGEYIIADVLGAIKLAEMLGLSIKEITEGISAMRPVQHRLQPIYNAHTKVLVIDDSYNGNPKGVEEAIKVLGKFAQNRRIYLTPGLVESGQSAEKIHYNIGKQLAPVAGLVILIKNTVTPFIEKGLLENGFKQENILWFNSAKQAHDSLRNVLRQYDVILFQNDWPDNYL